MENYAKLDPESGLSTRLLDFFQTFDFIVGTAFEEKVDAVVFAGDAYKTRDPNPTQQKGFGERIKRLAKKVPVVLVVGNHDTPNAEGKANTLDIYSALEIENVYVSRRPELLTVPTKSGLLQVVTLPWLHKNDYKTIAEKLKMLYDQIKPDYPAILLSHTEVEGASYGSEKGLAIGSDVTIPLPLLQDNRLSYVALGHIHKHQVLSKNPLVVYCGSPQRIDFGEEKEEKGICLVEITPSIVNFQFIPANARKFLTITINIRGDDPDPTQTILTEIKNHHLEDKIVRVIINIPKECEQEIQMDKIKKTLSKVYFLAGISRNIERIDRAKLDTTQVETLTPMEALKKYFEAKKYPPNQQKLLQEYASRLLEK